MCLYFMTNKSNTTLYVGITNCLARRIEEHKRGKGSEFTRRYNLHKLIYFEAAGSPESAIEREKQIKGWSRARKVALIENLNPKWNDLFGRVLDDPDTDIS
jgi:putative endonuclease